MIFFEILGIIILLGLMSLFSLLILPGMFGCFGLLIFIGVFFWLLYFFSAGIGWFILIAAAYYLVVSIVKYNRYKKLPDYATYIALNPNPDSVIETYCQYCRFKEKMPVALFGFNSRLYYYVCINCHKSLYRFKVLS